MRKGTETAIGAALAAKGITARGVALDKAIALFRNNGGTYAGALDRLNAAYADDASRFSAAGRVLSERAVALRMNDDGGGQNANADMAMSPVPSPSSPERSAGHAIDADKAGSAMPVAAPHKPGHAKRGAAAIAAVQATMAKSLFDTVRLPGDDRAIGDVTWKELQGLARKHAEAYRLLSLIDGYCQPADPDAPVRSVIKEETLREFVEIARLSNVH